MSTQLTAHSRQVRAARRLTRRTLRAQERRFLAEGPQSVREALALDGVVVQLFATGDAGARHPELVAAASAAGVPWQVVPRHVLDLLAQTVTPQGVVAVCNFVDRPLEEVAHGGARLLALCADVRDPGNAGAVIRCADAAGADGVVLAGSSVDVYNGKTVRATAGSLFHLPVAVGGSAASAVAAARSAGLRVLAADGAGERDLFEAESSGLLDGAVAWMFGNESWGLPDDTAALADAVVRVPILGRAESLNLATAAAVCLYASARRAR